jgi:hypothetical protein
MVEQIGQALAASTLLDAALSAPVDVAIWPWRAVEVKKSVNIEGKARRFLPYLDPEDVGGYRRKCAEVAEKE